MDSWMMTLDEMTNVSMVDLGLKKIIITGISRLILKSYMNRNPGFSSRLSFKNMTKDVFYM